MKNCMSKNTIISKIKKKPSVKKPKDQVIGMMISVTKKSQKVKLK